MEARGMQTMQMTSLHRSRVDWQIIRLYVLIPRLITPNMTVPPATEPQVHCKLPSKMTMVQEDLLQTYQIIGQNPTHVLAFFQPVIFVAVLSLPRLHQQLVFLVK